MSIGFPLWMIIAAGVVIVVVVAVLVLTGDKRKDD